MGDAPSAYDEASQCTRSIEGQAKEDLTLCIREGGGLQLTVKEEVRGAQVSVDGGLALSPPRISHSYQRRRIITMANPPILVVRRHGSTSGVVVLGVDRRRNIHCDGPCFVVNEGGSQRFE